MWCQKGVRVQVAESGRRGYINVVLFANIFVIFEDTNQPQKFKFSDVFPVEVTEGEQVIVFGGKVSLLNKVGTCLEVDKAKKTAKLFFRGMEPCDFPLDLI